MQHASQLRITGIVLIVAGMVLTAVTNFLIGGAPLFAGLILMTFRFEWREYGWLIALLLPITVGAVLVNTNHEAIGGSLFIAAGVIALAWFWRSGGDEREQLINDKAMAFAMTGTATSALVYWLLQNAWELPRIRTFWALVGMLGWILIGVIIESRRH